MEVTEAIEWISEHFPSDDETEQSKAIRVALTAMRKQIDAKPNGTHYAHMKCPSCNHRIPSGMGSSSRRRDNWCNYCGQKIDWSATK